MPNDLIIIGAGPAGVAAGVYAARKKLKTVLIACDFGGQSLVSPDIQNWIGVKSISGEELARRLREHIESYVGPELVIKTGQKVVAARRRDSLFEVQTDAGKIFLAQTLLVASGASRRRLEASGAGEFDQKGITYCATCDGPLFAGKDVTIIGGGNAGFETAAQLLAYVKSVTLLHHNDKLKADETTVAKVKQHPNFKLILNAETQAFKGDKFIKSLIFKDVFTGKLREFKTEGVFVEIGIVPNTAFLGDLVELNQYKMIIVDPKTQRASRPGVWAAGDCADGFYHQNNIAAGDAVKALEDIYNFLRLKTG